MSTMKEIEEAIAKAVASYEAAVLAYEGGDGLRPASECPTKLIPHAAHGARMELDDGRAVFRRYEWVEIPVDAKAASCAARDLVRRVTSHGQGRIWFMGEPVHVIRDDGTAVRPGPDGFDVMRLRTIYYHEAHAFSPGTTAGTYENAVTSDVVTSSAMRIP